MIPNVKIYLLFTYEQLCVALSRKVILIYKAPHTLLPRCMERNALQRNILKYHEHYQNRIDQKSPTKYFALWKTCTTIGYNKLGWKPCYIHISKSRLTMTLSILYISIALIIMINGMDTITRI